MIDNIVVLIKFPKNEDRKIYRDFNLSLWMILES
jgi:hypothetical protein